MTTTITPGVGAAPLFVQQGVGASPGYSAIDLRRSDSLGLQEGVYEASDFMVVQRAAGANMSVDIGMPAGGFACVQGDSVSGQGLYTVPVHSATINEAVTAANATNPRIDQVILEVLDNVHDVSGGNRAQIRVVAGTATAGATLNNRTGAAALPSSALLLADVLVGAAVTTIPNTVIRDRRKWARGAYLTVLRTSSAAATASTTFIEIDTTTLKPRIECSGAPMRMGLRGRVANSTSGAATIVAPAMDGVNIGSQTDAFAAIAGAANDEQWFNLSWEFVPAAGSHQLSFITRVTAGTATFQATGTAPLNLTIEEIVRQNTPNNATTTG